MQELRIDPEFQARLRPLLEGERAGLEQSLLEDGCLSPIVIWNGFIVDGHNRYELCNKHKIPYETTGMLFGGRDEVLDWIGKNQSNRRNDPEELQRYQNGKRLEKKDNVTGHPKEQVKVTGSSGGTVASISDELGISKATLKRSAAYAKALDELEVAFPGLKEAVLSGKRKISQDKIKKAAKALKTSRDDADAILNPKDVEEPEAAPDEQPVAPVSLGLAPLTPQEEADKVMLDSLDRAAGIKEQRQKLVAIKKFINDASNLPGGELISQGKNRMLTDLDNLDRELRFSMPYAACPYCKNTLPDVLSCQGCGNRGWVNESIYKSAPDNPLPASAQRKKLEAIGDI